MGKKKKNVELPPIDAVLREAASQDLFLREQLPRTPEATAALLSSAMDAVRRRMNDGSAKGTNAANASHAKHVQNKKDVREWYAKNRHLTKNAAAEKIIELRIVAASFDTVRDYLKGQ